MLSKIVKNLDVYESNQQKLNRILLYIKEEIARKKNKEAIERIERCLRSLTTTPISMPISKLYDLLKIANEFIHDVYSDE
jgi:hypothetical protein